LKAYINILLLILPLSIFAQREFPPAVGQLGSTAIHKDSVVFKDWAASCVVKRGMQDIAKPLLDTVSIGTSSNALGKADGSRIVSLGDAGEAILSFSGNIYDGPGPDFAVFENAFNATFLELAFVEVSSDGINFYRFPSESLTDTTKEVGSFGSVYAYYVHNLAGKYQANYGTPFDLDDLKDEVGLDVQNITHIKIIDVVGTLDSAHVRRDSKGRKINDQYPTPFPSGGFDLDAIGVIHTTAVGLEENKLSSISLYPNPCSDVLNIGQGWNNATYKLINTKGNLVKEGILNEEEIVVADLAKGVYFIQIIGGKGKAHAKFFKQ